VGHGVGTKTLLPARKRETQFPGPDAASARVPPVYGEVELHRTEAWLTCNQCFPLPHYYGGALEDSSGAQVPADEQWASTIRRTDGLGISIGSAL
jgi:hypothetical protein